MQQVPYKWALPIPDEIEGYAAEHTTALPPLIKELLEASKKLGPRAIMASGQVEGSILQTLVAGTGAKRVLDIGTFVGFSALMMAEAMPDDGKLITFEIDPEAIAIAREFFARSPHGHKIELREGPALENLKTVQGPIDFAFIDADKENYANYYEILVPLLSPKGIIAVDNILWQGRVAYPDNYEGEDFLVKGTRNMDAFNKMVIADKRVKSVILTVRDGISLIRRA